MRWQCLYARFDLESCVSRNHACVCRTDALAVAGVEKIDDDHRHCALRKNKTLFLWLRI